MAKLFTGDDFDKNLHIGDELIFDKQDLKTLRVDLTWRGTDLDVCAFLLGKDKLIHAKEDLVYFKSQLRWLPREAFDAPNFSPLKGRMSTWEQDGHSYKNPSKWMEATLPVSADGSVIGSWDDMSTEDNNDECGETLHILLEEVDTHNYTTIILAATVAKEKIKIGETFEGAHTPIVSIYDADTDELIAEYRLDQQFPKKDVVAFGKMEYDSNTFLWSFVPMSDAYVGGMEYLATEIYS